MTIKANKKCNLLIPTKTKNIKSRSQERKKYIYIKNLLNIEQIKINLTQT